MRIAEIWRYPVKSMGGERLDVADVTPDGIDGDRAWGVLDPTT
ncbi:MAG: MOSC N-terminal beta barrel domain-containing protein, partial [Acidimicrobiia bacterium]